MLLLAENGHCISNGSGTLDNGSEPDDMEVDMGQFDDAEPPEL